MRKQLEKEGGMLVKNVIAAGVVSLLCLMQADADILQPNTHTLVRCATIGNLDDFPDIAVVGAYTEVNSAGIKRYLVKSDSCLHRGYKFGTFNLIWVEKAYLDSEGLDSLPLDRFFVDVSAKKRWGTVTQLGLIPMSGPIFSDVVPDSNPVVNEELVYNLMMTSSTGFGIWLAKKVTTDKSGVEISATYNPIVHTDRTIDRQPATAMHLHTRLSSDRLVITPDFGGKISGALYDCRGRTAGSFQREVRPGATYLIPCTGAASGIYWLRITDGRSTASIRLSALE
jgi:hypothetical protein